MTDAEIVLYALIFLTLWTMLSSRRRERRNMFEFLYDAFSLPYRTYPLPADDTEKNHPQSTVPTPAPQEAPMTNSTTGWQPFPSRDDGSIAWRVFHQMHDWLEKRGVKIDLGDDLEMRDLQSSPIRWRTSTTEVAVMVDSFTVTSVKITESTR